MSPILFVLFLAILDQIQAQSSPIESCDCPLPGSEPYDNYEYHEYKKPYGKAGPQKGICTSTKQRFASQCWLKLYNHVHGNYEVPARDSECRKSKCLIPCSQPGFDDGYNPICVTDRKSANLTTLRNICALECSERDFGISYEVLHCGTCDTKCSEILPELDCLRPPDGCTLPAVPDPEDEDCDCSSEVAGFVCTINVDSRLQMSFFSICGLNCAQMDNPNLQLLYGVGDGKCPCLN